MSIHTPATRPADYAIHRTWTNWGGNQTCTPAFTVHPRSEQEVVDAVRFAVAENLSVRAVGGGHSFTPIVQTGGVLIHTDALTGLTGVDTDRNRVRLYGGTWLEDIGDPLWDNGLALTNQGDSAQESIAGVLATAAHGSGARQTCFSERLRWARIVNGHGEVVKVDENDLDRLRAAQVAIGTLGIMTEVELAASPAITCRRRSATRTGTRSRPSWPTTSPTSGTTRSSGVRPTIPPTCTNCRVRRAWRWPTVPTRRSTARWRSPNPTASAPRRARGSIAPTESTTPAA